MLVLGVRTHLFREGELKELESENFGSLRGSLRIDNKLVNSQRKQDKGSFSGLRFDSAHLHFGLSNMAPNVLPWRVTLGRLVPLD